MSDHEMAQPLPRALGRETDQQRASSVCSIGTAFDTASALLDPEVPRRLDVSERNRLLETQRESVHSTDFSCLDFTKATEICRRFG